MNRRLQVHDLFSLPPDSPNAQLTPSVAAADGGSFFGNSAADGFAGDHNKSWVSNNNNKSQASVQVSQSAGSNRGKPNNHKGKKKLLTPVSVICLSFYLSIYLCVSCVLWMMDKR